ncbi:MAG: amidohydrolase [Candidatus Marinimicrobia bacterium]|nr:amidohydrolase [Candidatus Neomarinimicrobiota bacterium]
MNDNFKKIIDEIQILRQRLHREPELSYKEFKTTRMIRKTLEEWSIPFYPFQNLDTGGYAEIGSGKTLLYRSDIDALPIIENPDHDFCSISDGVMHACGHDYHTAIGLGLLRYFQFFPEKLNGKLRVIFQPAEEATPTGAAEVIKENIWNDAIAILGIHVNSEDTPGQFSLSKMAANGSNTTVEIHLKGPGGHTSRPDQSVDLILITCEYVSLMHSFIKNKIDPRDTVSFTFGKIAGGHVKNAIPQSMELGGTLRTHSNDVLDQARRLILKFSQNFATLHDMQINVAFPTSCPVAINDSKLVSKFIDYFSKQKDQQLIILPKPSMGADDFSFYLDRVPGLYVRVGGAGKGAAHTGDFIINEALIGPAIKHLTGFIEYFFRAE